MVTCTLLTIHGLVREAYLANYHQIMVEKRTMLVTLHEFISLNYARQYRRSFLTEISGLLLIGQSVHITRAPAQGTLK